MPSQTTSGSSAKAARRPGKGKLTRDRLLDAALVVFSREGQAATTREIARVAGVNEATLFRQFETKDRLLAELTRRIVRDHADALDRVDFEQFDLRRDLTRVAAAYDKSSTEHMGFIRTMMSGPADPKLSEQITRDFVEPLRAKFMAYLAEGQRRGLVRQLELAPAVDLFTGSLFAGALRRSMFRSGYSRDAYLHTCVEVFLKGIAP